MSLLRIMYHVSNGFLTMCTTFMTFTALLWLAYFLSQIYSNYKSCKNLQLRFNDIEIPGKIRSIKKTIQRDFFFIFILTFELIVPIIACVQLLVPFMYHSINGNTDNSMRIKYNCTRFPNGSYLYLLSKFGSVVLIIEALRQGALIIHIRLYKLMIEFFILEYRRVSFGRAFYFNIFVTCVQFLLVVALTSILQTYVIGTTLSVLLLITNIFSVAHSGKILYLNLKCYLQEIRLIHTFDAIDEYKRVLKMTKKYKISMIFFTAFLLVLFVGSVAYAVGCVWLEWVFLIDCEGLNPYIKTINISHVIKDDLLDISLFSRLCLSISGGIYFLGMVGVSIALGWNILYSWKRKQYIPKPELIRHLI